MYRLTRDDRAELRVSGRLWETALELAYLHGWRPAGTKAPQTEAWLQQRTSPADVPVWDSQDYFSYACQRVGQDDASTLSQAVTRALVHMPVGGFRPASVPPPAPSRTATIAAGLNVPARRLMHSFAVFAGRGGFTIDSAP